MLCKMRIQCKVIIIFCLICLLDAKGSSTPKGSHSSKWPSWLRNIKEGRWPWRRRDDRAFERGTGSNLVMVPGDTIVSGMIPNRYRLNHPYRWMYAVDTKHVIAFWPGLVGLAKVKHGTTNAHLVEISHALTNAKLMNRKQKKGHIGPVGTLIATLMIESQKSLPFHLFWCAGKHYVEYLSLGEAEGSYLSYMHNRLMDNCPVRAPLHATMAAGIFRSGRFTLTGLNGEHPIHLALPGVENVPEDATAEALWPSYIRNMRQLFQ